MEQDDAKRRAEDQKPSLDMRSNKKEITGKCEICYANDARFICIKCGRKVCSSCYFNIIGLCQKCVSKDTVERWKGRAPDWEKVLGIEWVD
ncbi:MAG TPA: hypothetical protein ENG74_03920 [Thermoplasmatales archaeon]|nr:hypothetical protein [Thermoplasmatales archaeon]